MSDASENKFTVLKNAHLFVVILSLANPFSDTGALYIPKLFELEFNKKPGEWWTGYSGNLY